MKALKTRLKRLAALARFGWKVIIWINFGPPYPFPKFFNGGYHQGDTNIRYWGTTFVLGTLRFEVYW